MQVNLLTK